jgi:uncharacterized protein
MTVTEEAERIICGNLALSAADNALADLYRQLSRSLSGSALVQLRNGQRDWLHTRAQCVGLDAMSCIARAYDQRLRQLQDQLTKLPQNEETR